jgi:hypothetical protein
MEGTLDCFFGRLVHARRQKGDLGGSRNDVSVRTITASRERRQGCQRLGTHRSRWEENAQRDEASPSKEAMCDPLKRIALTCIRQSPRAASCESGSTTARTDGARVRVRRSEMAEVGPTHRAFESRASRKASSRKGAG